MQESPNGTNGKKSKQRRSREPLKGDLAAFAVFSVGTILSFLLYGYVSTWQKDRDELRFIGEASRAATLLQRSVERTFDILRACSPFEGRDTAAPMSKELFHAAVAHPLISQRGLREVLWVPVVEDADRDTFVAQVRDSGEPDFDIVDLDAQGRAGSAARRDRYYPVRHEAFGEQRRSVSGLDLAGDASRLRAFSEAGIAERMVVSMAGALPGRNAVESIMEVVQPIYAGAADGGKRVKGMVLVRLDVDMLAAGSLGEVAAETIAMNLYHGRPKGVAVTDALGVESGTALSFTAPINVAGQNWTVECAPTAAFFARDSLWSPWQIVAAGVFLSLLVATHIYDLTGRRVQIERVVVERTRELSLANAELETEIAVRRQTEEALRKISRAVEQSANLVVITDLDNLVDYVNPRFEELTGYAAEEVAGRSWDSLVADTASQSIVADVREAIAQSRDWQGELQTRTKYDKPLRLSTTVSPIRNENGDVTHYLYVHVDVTEQKKLEEQFLQAQKMEIIGRLVGGIAHDFNNILTTIMGFGQIFLRKLEPDHWMRSGLEEIVHAAERASHLTRQLLTFARKRKQDAVNVNLDVNEVVRNMEKLLRRAVSEDIELITLLEDDIGAFEGDQSQFEQILMNLAVNARDAMPRGGKFILRTRRVVLDEEYCSGRLSLEGGPCVMVSVADTGCGMSEEVIKQVFEPFFTTKDPGKGTGLGLATVYGIVKQFGGDIEIYSEVGVGTEFKMYFPVSAAMGDGLQVVKFGEEPPRGEETILVVEDDSAVRQVAVTTLTELGYQVHEACHGEEALDICTNRNGHIDLLLVDVVMPKMSGPALVEELKQRHAPYKYVFTSGFTEHPSMKEEANFGDARFIEKPFTRERLGRTIREVLDAA